MRLKVQLKRLMVVGCLVVMTTGISQAGGANWCPCDDDPITASGGIIYAGAVLEALGNILVAALNI